MVPTQQIVPNQSPQEYRTTGPDGADVSTSSGAMAAGSETVVPEAMAVETPEEDTDVDMGPVKSGWYINSCLNTFWKITLKTNADPPAYTSQCMCFTLEWVIPIPCCCCPAENFTLQPEDPEARPDEVDCTIYQAPMTRHVWKADGKLLSKSKFGNDSMKWIRS